MNTDLMFSSQSDNWATPQDFFEKINKEFDFNLDPCADEINHKCEKYYTREQNGLDFSWGGVPSILQSAVWKGYRFVG